MRPKVARRPAGRCGHLNAPGEIGCVMNTLALSLYLLRLLHRVRSATRSLGAEYRATSPRTFLGSRAMRVPKHLVTLAVGVLVGGIVAVGATAAVNASATASSVT